MSFIERALRERFGVERWYALRGLHAVAEGFARRAHRLLRDGFI